VISVEVPGPAGASAEWPVRAAIRARRAALWTAAAALAALAPAAARAQDQAPPCPAALLATPAFNVVDEPEAGGTDPHAYASHPLMISAAFPLEAQADTSAAIWTLPPAFAVLPPAPVRSLRADTDAATVEGIAQAAGPYPVTVTWTQTDGTHNGRCTGSANSSFDVTNAVPPKLRRPKVTGGLPSESTVKLVLARHGGDLRPLEVHVRWVRSQRFPGARARERVVTVPQLAIDPAFAGLRDTSVRAGGVRIDVRPVVSEGLAGLSFVVEVRVSGTRQSIPFGYDLDVRQGGRTATRLRVAGRCRFFSGFVTCRTRRVSLS
jgi:hypothetical protein